MLNFFIKFKFKIYVYPVQRTDKKKLFKKLNVTEILYFVHYINISNVICVIYFRYGRAKIKSSKKILHPRWQDSL